MPKEKTKVEECEGCRLKRTLQNYREPNYRMPGSPVEDKWMCLSCANVLGVASLKVGEQHYIGQLLLTVNSKLDLLLKKGSR